MMDFLGVTHNCQQRKGGFDHHAVVPGSLFAEFDVVGHARSTAKAPVSPERLQMAPVWADHGQVKGVSMDGGMVNIRQQGWKEMKVGAIYDVALRLEYDQLNL